MAYAIPSNYYDLIRSAESGGDDSAKNPNSSASGRYQFTRGTWEALGYNWADRFDASLQEEAVRKLTNQNAGVLAGSGISINSATLYGAHFLGSSAASKVLGANNNTALSSLLPQNVFNANPFLRGMDVGDFKNWLVRKTGGGSSTQSATEALSGAGQSIGNLGEYLGIDTSRLTGFLGTGSQLLDVSGDVLKNYMSGGVLGAAGSLLNNTATGLATKLLGGTAGNLVGAGLSFLTGNPIAAGLQIAGSLPIVGDLLRKVPVLGKLFGSGESAKDGFFSKLSEWWEEFFSADTAARFVAVLIGVLLLAAAIFAFANSGKVERAVKSALEA